MCTKIFFSIHSVKISNVFFFLSRGYNLFMAHFKDLVLKNRIQMGKNMRMNFFKQRITVILLLVASVCICGSINEFYVFENDYYFKYLLNTFTGIILLTGIAYLCYPQKKTNQENELVLNANWCMKRSLSHRNILFLIQKLGTH